MATLKPCTTVSNEEAEERGWKVARGRRLVAGGGECLPNPIGIGRW